MARASLRFTAGDLQSVVSIATAATAEGLTDVGGDRPHGVPQLVDVEELAAW